MTHIYERLSLIGVGLIGASIAKACKEKGLVKHITGYVRSEENRHILKNHHICDEVALDIKQAVMDADLVILATPLGAMGAIAQAMAPHLKKGAVISDVGSSKQAVIDAVGDFLPDFVHFLPAHPIAGTEHSGPLAGFATLFENRYCIITPPSQPLDKAGKQALEQLSKLWQGMGAEVELMAPHHHDRVLAVTSHLPHLLSYSLVRTASDLEQSMRNEKLDETEIINKQEVMKFSAGGFRDFTRIADSDPIMWRDVFLSNKPAVLEMVKRFQKDLQQLEKAIEKDNGALLLEWFTETKSIRKGIIELKQAGTFKPEEPDYQE